jgi:hypothetical protein
MRSLVCKVREVERTVSRRELSPGDDDLGSVSARSRRCVWEPAEGRHSDQQSRVRVDARRSSAL